MKTIPYFVLIIFCVNWEIFSAKISPLHNQTYLLTSGSHGLRISQFGSAFIFSGSWSQLFLIRFPSILYGNYSLPRVELFCDNQADKVEICQSFNKLTSTLTNVSNNFASLLQMKFQNVLNQEVPQSWISRKKRSVFPFVGEAMSFFFGTSSKSDINGLKDKIDFIAKKVVQSDKKTELLKNELIGLTEVIQKRTEHVNKAFEQIATEITKLESLLLKYTEQLLYVIYDLKIGAKIEECIISTIVEMYNQIMYSLTVEDIEEALISLRRGLLPPNLISPDILQTILFQVEHSVQPLYKLGIRDKNIDFYYILPLIQYKITNEGIILKLSIPLQSIKTETEYNILKAISSPIPCSESVCQWNNRLQSDDVFITLAIRDRCWLTDKQNIELKGEIDLATLSCITISGNNLCFTLDRSLMQTISSCTASLWDWNQNLIKKHCSFEISLRDNYHPIRMSENSWIIHRDIISSYDIICEKMMSGSGAKSRILQDWSEEVRIDANCYLSTDKFELYGPLRERDSRLDSVPTKSPVFIFDSRFEPQPPQINDNDLDHSKNFEKIERFDKNQMNDYLTLDQKAITSVVNRIYEYTDRFDQEMFDLNTEKHNTKNFISWQTSINSLTKVGLFFTLTVILIMFIRMGNGIYGIAPLIIAEIDRIEATSIRPRDSVYLWNSLNNDPFNFMINFSLLICGVILFYSVCKLKYLRTLSHTVHYGKIDNDLATNFLIISFKHINYWSFHPFIREIIIKFPINCLPDSEEFAQMQVIGNFKIWQVFPKDKKALFRLLSPVKLFIETGGSQTERQQRVEFELDTIEWSYGGRPRYIKTWNTYGDCHVSHFREQTTSTNCFRANF